MFGLGLLLHKSRRLFSRMWAAVRWRTWSVLLIVLIVLLAVPSVILWHFGTTALTLTITAAAAAVLVGAGWAIAQHMTKPRSSLRVECSLYIKEPFLPPFRWTLHLKVVGTYEEKGQVLRQYEQDITLRLRAPNRETLLEYAQLMYEKTLRLWQERHPHATVLAPARLNQLVLT